MLKLASFEDPDTAKALDEQLSLADIPTVLRAEAGDARAIWLVAEQDLPRAQAVLARFVAAHATTRGAGANAAAQGGRGWNARALWRQIADSPVTSGVLAACVVVAIYTGLGDDREHVQQLTIGSLPLPGSTRWSAWDDLRAGQLWRLFTPVLLHFHPFHLLFNAFMLRDLGLPAERLQGPLQYSLFLLLAALVSNLAQLIFGHSPNFGGLSGVVYALIGYVWARGAADPYSGFALSKGYLLFFVGWMALGFSGVMNRIPGGAMANWCHLGGFAVGTVYGYIAARIATSRVRRSKASLS